MRLRGRGIAVNRSESETNVDEARSVAYLVTRLVVRREKLNIDLGVVRLVEEDTSVDNQS